jgi:hypothetical protein
LLSDTTVLDDERAAHIRSVVHAHAGIPVLACSQFAATVDAMWQRLRDMPGCAALTARGARIASGPIARDLALARFAPIATRAHIPHERERIRLLLATDLVSEGLNLQDAGVVIHLDTPWTAARLAQRVGRVARVTSKHEQVHTYAVAPPRAAAALLGLERRIKAKRRVAGALIGGGTRLSQLIGGTAPAQLSPAEHFAQIRELLRPWSAPRVDRRRVCGVAAPVRGWLALIVTGDGPRMAMRLGQASPTTDPATVVRGIHWLTAGDEHWLPADWESILADVERWMSRERGRELSGAFRPHASRERGRELAAVMTTIAASMPHARARIAAETLAEAPSSFNGDASLTALVIFCRRDETENTHGAPL